MLWFNLLLAASCLCWGVTFLYMIYNLRKDDLEISNFDVIFLIPIYFLYIKKQKNIYVLCINIISFVLFIIAIAYLQ